jgi:hypothetical protein
LTLNSAPCGYCDATGVSLSIAPVECEVCLGLGKLYEEGAYTPIVHASDVAVLRTCLRKWHGVLVQGQREPEGEATKRGTAIHAMLEHYLDTGEPIPTDTLYGRIAASGYKYLPAPRSGITEQHFRLFGPIVDDEPLFAYYGAIDWISATERKVKDHKTTSNFKYQKTEATLRGDPQVVVYGSFAAETRPPGTSSDIEFEWIYYLTQEKARRQARNTLFTMTEAELLAAKADLDQEIIRSISYRKLPFHSLPGTAKSCFMYGKPCHFKERCHDIKPTIGDLMATSKDELLASLKAKGLGAAAPPGVPLPPPVTAVAPPPAAAGLPTLPGLPGLPAVAPPPVAAAPALPGLPGLPTLPGLPSLAPPPVTATVPPPPAAAAAPPVLPAIAPPPAIDPATLAAAAAEEKGKKGKAKEPALATPPPAAPPPVTDSRIGVLYINCLPIGQSVNDFGEIARICHDAVREHRGLAHYKLAEFGHGQAVWCEVLRMYLGAMPVDSLYVDTSANDGRDALEVLIPLAAMVVRGIR